MKVNQTRTLAAALIGTMIEWYDYGLFGYLAPVFAELFFPNQSKWVSLLQAFTVFAVGYVLRPIGGMIFGSLADRLGRIVALRAAILLVSLPSLLIACLPTYAMIGGLSTALLIILRLLQGISVGGEFAGSMVYLTEISPPRYKTLFSGLANNASNTGVLIGIGCCTLLTTLLPHDKFMQFGWRIPFIIGGLFGIIGYYLRKVFIESDAFLALQKEKKLYPKPISTIFKHYRSRVVTGIFLCCMGACGIYTLTTYISTYLQIVKHYPLNIALALQSVLLICTLFLVPFASILAERYKKLTLLSIAVCGNILYSVFAFLYLPEHNIVLAGIVLFPLILFISIEQGVMPATLSEFFPVAIRYSAVSIAYNVSYAYLGGTAPMYITWLITKTGSPLIPGFCILMASTLTGLALMQLRDKLSPKNIYLGEASCQRM
jgi:MHS family proline/betaine transporter-like MFS transporter